MSVTPWVRCYDCGKIVRVNKPLVGSMHLCLSDEALQARNGPVVAKRKTPSRKIPARGVSSDG